MEKKVCAFELRPVLIEKYTKSFGGKIFCSMLTIFSHQNSSIFFVLMLDAVQIRRFFFLSATLHTQKKVKESLYFDQLPGPFKSATLFFIICLLNNREGRDNMMEMSFYLFLLLIFFLVIQLFVTDKQKCLRKEHNNMESQHDK